MAFSKILGVVTVAAATILLGIVAFDVPYFKSIFFLRIDLSGNTASLSNTNQTTPFVDLGVLGFCTDLKDGKGLQCSKAQIGYSLSEASQFINGSLPHILSDGVNVVAGALTKVLVVHLVAFAIAVISTGFALLALFGAPIAECCSSCFSGFSAAATFAVFIFDLAFFYIIKKRVNDEGGAGDAVMGNALWLTLAAWILLFVTPIMFLIGRCCGCARKAVNYEKLHH